ncbi:4936_t:CDS:2, partial [Funneliformis caledonium]
LELNIVRHLGEQVNNTTATGGKIITPAKTPEVISLSVVNSSRFLILGTKPEILEWLREHSHIKLEVHLFDDDKIEASHIHIPDIVTDILPTLDLTGNSQQRSFIDYINPLHHPDPSDEEVRLEFRPQNPKIDDNSEPYIRLVVKRSSSLGEIVDELQLKWDSMVYPSVWDNFKKITSSLLNEENDTLDSVVDDS